jgi:Transcriptional regulators
MLLNSIDEECFERRGDTATLTLKADDLVDTLKTFADKLDEDEELSEQLEDLVGADVSALISLATGYLEEAADEMDFELVWTISYDGGKPVGTEISYDDGTDYGSFDFLFEYEKTSDGKDITMNVTAGGMETKGELSVSIDGNDMELDGNITVSYGGEQYASYDIKGSSSVDGEEVEGSFEFTDDYSTVSVEYSGTMAFGMPEDMVEDDDRFDLDTSGAYVQDISDIFSVDRFTSGFGFGSGGGWYTEPAVSAAAPSEEVSAAPAYSTGVIGVILPTVNTTYYITLRDNLISEASYYGWELSVYTTDYMGSEQAALQALLAEGCDAVIIDPIGLNDYSIQSLEGVCIEAGMPCVMLLDEGETADGSVSAVWYDLAYSGADMAYYVYSYYDGDVFVIGGDVASNEAYYVESGLYYDSTYGISYNANVSVVGTAYASDYSSTAVMIDDALTAYSPDTFVCTDADISYEVLQALEAQGFTGNLICYTYETAMNEMYDINYYTYIVYEYYDISDVAYDCILAVVDQIEYYYSPQVYTVQSYGY